MTYQPLRSRLPAFDQRHAATQTRVLAALGELRAATCAVPSAVIAFASDAGPVELAPLGALLVADDGSPDAVAAVAALAAIEPLVAAIEARLGVALRPVGVGAATLPLWLRVETQGHVAALGIAPDAKFTLPPVALSAAADRLRSAFTFHADGPLLSLAALSALATGDVVLLGGATLGGQIAFAGTTRPARFRPAAAAVTFAEPRGTIPVNEPADTQLDPALRLPLTVEIAGGSAELGLLTSLAPGSVVPLGIEGAALPVTLSVGGNAIATGELVAIGDAYGVLVTRRLDTSS